MLYRSLHCFLWQLFLSLNKEKIALYLEMISSNIFEIPHKYLTLCLTCTLHVTCQITLNSLAVEWNIRVP